MKGYLIFFLTITISVSVLGQKEIQAKELSNKEIRKLKRKKAFEKQKLLSARIDTQRGLVIIRQSESMNNSQHYPLWIVDGLQFNFPPNNIALQNIREVNIYESLSETNKWGQLGRAGVIEIITLNSLK